MRACILEVSGFRALELTLSGVLGFRSSGLKCRGLQGSGLELGLAGFRHLSQACITRACALHTEFLAQTSP